MPQMRVPAIDIWLKTIVAVANASKPMMFPTNTKVVFGFIRFM